MTLPSLTSLTIQELLATHSAVLDELKRQEVIRSKNNPTGDYAEWLIQEKLGLKLTETSAKGYDATDSNGLRYQIKARRVTHDNRSTQLGVIRNLKSADFHFLIAPWHHTVRSLRFDARGLDQPAVFFVILAHARRELPGRIGRDTHALVRPQDESRCPHQMNRK